MNVHNHAVIGLKWQARICRDWTPVDRSTPNSIHSTALDSLRFGIKASGDSG